MLRLLLDPQGGSGSGNDDDKDRKKGEPPDMAALVESLLKKHGTADNALAKLIDENYGLRERNRQLRERVPDPDSVVLTAEQAKEWAGYQALGTLPELRKSQVKASQDAAALETERRANVLRDVQDVHGYSPGVLGAVLEKREVRFVGEAKGKDGKPVAAHYAVVEQGEDGTEKATPLPDWLNENKREFLPALLPQTGPTRPPGTPPPRTPAGPPPPDGKPLISADARARAKEQLRATGRHVPY